jgi:hypothetical protein
MAIDAKRAAIRGGPPLRLAAAGLLALAFFAGCAENVTSDPRGPYASPNQSPAQAVIAQGCASSALPGQLSTDVEFVRTALVRQEAILQRVSEDITGAVPGGEFTKDAGLAKTNARQIMDLVDRSTLCSPYKEGLSAAAKELVKADDALAAATAGSEQAALQSSQAALQALKAKVENPPKPAASPRR